MERRSIRAAGELANVLTHGVGLAAALIGGVVLIVLASLQGDAWKIVGVSIFGATLVTLYAASTLYHASCRPERKRWLRLFDHAAIYLLIAGTYTPFLVNNLRGEWGWTLFGIVWGLAVAGIGFKLVFIGRFHLLSTLLYVGMGLIALPAIGPLIDHLPTATLAWLVAGGIAYIAGTLFYHSRRLRHAHTVWHLFVIGGSACHWIAVSTII